MNDGVVLAVLMASACVLAGAAGSRPVAVPTITSFTPRHGAAGSKITICAWGEFAQALT